MDFKAQYGRGPELNRTPQRIATTQALVLQGRQSNARKEGKKRFPNGTNMVMAIGEGDMLYRHPGVSSSRASEGDMRSTTNGRVFNSINDMPVDCLISFAGVAMTSWNPAQPKVNPLLTVQFGGVKSVRYNGFEAVHAGDFLAIKKPEEIGDTGRYRTPPTAKNPSSRMTMVMYPVKDSAMNLAGTLQPIHAAMRAISANPAGNNAYAASRLAFEKDRDFLFPNGDHMLGAGAAAGLPFLAVFKTAMSKAMKKNNLSKDQWSSDKKVKFIVNGLAVYLHDGHHHGTQFILGMIREATALLMTIIYENEVRQTHHIIGQALTYARQNDLVDIDLDRRR